MDEGKYSRIKSLRARKQGPRSLNRAADPFETGRVTSGEIRRELSQSPFKKAQPLRAANAWEKDGRGSIRNAPPACAYAMESGVRAEMTPLPVAIAGKEDRKDNG